MVNLGPDALLDEDDIKSQADLRDADLHGADLRGADLHGADLSNARFHGADLSNADLTNADLRSADLSNADLSHTDLSRTDVGYANLTDADLSNATPTNARLHKVDLTNADLSHADLSHTDLSHADLTNADLSHTDLSHTTLFNIDLCKADVTAAVLTEAVVHDAQGERTLATKQTLHELGAVIRSTENDSANQSDELHSEIRRVTDEIGQTPTLTEFEETTPSAYALYQRSDRSWMETLDDAGVLSSKDDIIREINRVTEATDRVPKAGEFIDRTNTRSAVYQHHFGNWITALDAAGVLPTKSELVDHVRALSDELGPIPDKSNLLDKSKYPRSVYDYLFDSWREVITAAGLLPSEEEMTSQIRTISETTGSIPSREIVVERGNYEAQAYEFQFSSWEKALEAAGVLPSKAEFLSLVRSATTRSGWLDQNAIYGKDALPDEYHTQFFDSWKMTLDAAGLLLSEEEFLSLLRCGDGSTQWLHECEFYQATDLPDDYHTLFFGSWAEALETAGIAPTREEFLSMVQEAETDRHWVDKEQVYEDAGIPTDYHTRFFDSWEETLDAAGFFDEELFITEVKRVVAEQGPVVTPDDVYEASALPEDYHEQFYDSWKEVLVTTGALDGALPAPTEERLYELDTNWGRPPSEEYVRRHLEINTRATLSDGLSIELDWEAMLEVTGLDPDDVDPDADLIKEIELLADTLEHRPNRTEVKEYLLKESNYVASRGEIDDAIEQAVVPAERDLTPTRSLTRRRYESNSDDIPSHTDLLVELNIIRSRTKSNKDALKSEFETRGVIDEWHYSIQFGSLAAAVDELLAIDTRRFREPIERNFSLTPGMLRDTVRDLGEILERPPLLEEVVFLGESSIADFVETFDLWADVTNTDSTVRSWSNEELFDNVEEVGRNLGKPPTHEELLEFGAVPVQCLLRRFGTWPRVLWLVGVDIDSIPHDYLAYEFTSELWNTTDYLVREEFGHDHALFDELHRLTFEFDCVPSEELIQRYSPYALEKFTRAFGSITAATDRAGITTSDAGRPPTPRREEFLRGLQSISETATTWVLPQDISLHTEYSVGTYLGVFKSLENALEQANLPTDHLVGPTETYSDVWHAEHQMKTGILRTIADLASRDEDEVTMSRLQSVAGISQNVIYRFFDDWDEAREAARVRESLGTVEVDPDEVENPDFVDDLLSEMDEMME